MITAILFLIIVTIEKIIPRSIIINFIYECFSSYSAKKPTPKQKEENIAMATILDSPEPGQC